LLGAFGFWGAHVAGAKAAATAWQWAVKPPSSAICLPAFLEQRCRQLFEGALVHREPAAH
jgi:hypothetical protein